MKSSRIRACALCTVVLAPLAAEAVVEEFFGIIGSRPSGDDIGAWIIGGRAVEVTSKSLLEEDNGPFVVGACVELAIEGNVLIEMSTEEKRACRN